jgi:hypothetical protein
MEKVSLTTDKTGTRNLSQRGQRALLAHTQSQGRREKSKSSGFALLAGLSYRQTPTRPWSLTSIAERMFPRGTRAASANGMMTYRHRHRPTERRERKEGRERRNTIHLFFADEVVAGDGHTSFSRSCRRLRQGRNQRLVSLAGQLQRVAILSLSFLFSFLTSLFLLLSPSPSCRQGSGSGSGRGLGWLGRCQPSQDPAASLGWGA